MIRTKGLPRTQFWKPEFGLFPPIKSGYAIVYNKTKFIIMNKSAYNIEQSSIYASKC